MRSILSFYFADVNYTKVDFFGPYPDRKRPCGSAVPNAARADGIQRVDADAVGSIPKGDDTDCMSPRFTSHRPSVNVHTVDKSSQKKEHPRESALPSETMPLPPSSLWDQPWTVLLLLSLLAILIYSDAFSASFHFDDYFFIVDNPLIKNFSSLLLSGTRYMGFLSFALNYHFGRLNVFGYHLVNLLIHIGNGFLVYTLIFTLFKTPRMQSSPLDPNRTFGIAIATALLFVVHPIQTEAVTYISQRFASLATLFYLLTVVLYLKWRLTSSESKGRHLWYAGAWVSTVLAMKTKEITFTLPFMLLLVEAVFFEPLTRKRWAALIPFLLTLPIIPLSHYPQGFGEGEEIFARETNSISRWDYLLTQFRVIVTYLRLLIFPVHQNLDYDYPIAHTLLDPPVFFSFLFLLSLFVFSLYLLFVSPRASHPSRFTIAASRLTAFGILWFFLTLSIESSIIPIRDVIFEHRLYLPSVGFLLAGSVAVLGLLDRRRGMQAIAICALVAVFSVATYQRNLVWRNDLTLWSDVVQKSPNKARGYSNLGKAYLDQKKWKVAIAYSRTSVSLDPNYAEPYNNLGIAYENLGRLDEAVQEYKMALRLKPDYAEAHNNLGKAYEDQRRPDEAIREYEAATTLNPDLADPHTRLGNVYENLGRPDEAIREYKTALTLKPDYAEAHNNLGVVYENLRHTDEAIREYKTALTLKPDYAEAHNNLGVVYLEQGKLSEALAAFEAAVQLKANYAKAHNNLGVVYQKQGRLEEAVREYEAAITLSPDYVEAHNNLGIVYKDLGRRDEAIREYKTALTLKPNYAVAHYNLGNVYNDLGRLEEAIREFEIALKLMPDFVQAQYHLGVAYHRKGQNQRAIDAFKRALQLKPDYEDARRALEALRQ
jgi:protein O-mannosyl-transferase